MRRGICWAAAVCGVAAVLAPAGHAGAAGPVVRPGSSADGCTFGFLFATTGSPERGPRYIASAGHCFVPQGTERTWLPGTGPAVTSGGVRVGELQYAIWNQRVPNAGVLTGGPAIAEPDPALPPHADFALVRLDKEVAADPSVCHFGGPTGPDLPAPPETRVARFYGNGLGIGLVPQTGTRPLPARSGALREIGTPWATGLRAVLSGGDSGMPVLDADGRAVGTLSALGWPMGSDPAPVARLGPHVARAEAALDKRLRLLTAPLRPDASPAGSTAC
jgi:hypothetical protein